MNGFEQQVMDALDTASQDRGLQPDNVLLAASLLRRGARLQAATRRFADADLHHGFMLNRAEFASDVRAEIEAELADAPEVVIDQAEVTDRPDIFDEATALGDVA
jgi:predicted TIM-barrel enzyme